MDRKHSTRLWFVFSILVMSLASQTMMAVPVLVAANPDVPISNVMIVASGEAGYGFNVTNAFGKYVLTRGLTAGTYNVTAIAEGYIMQELGDVNVIVGSETGGVNFFLVRSGGISGRVTASGTGKGVANISVMAFTEGQYGWFTTTGADGYYKIITNLPTDTYDVTVMLPRVTWEKTVSGVNVVAGTETKNVDLVLESFGSNLGEGDD